jgi:hypothetical protein
MGLFRRKQFEPEGYYGAIPYRAAKGGSVEALIDGKVRKFKSIEDFVASFQQPSPPQSTVIASEPPATKQPARGSKKSGCGCLIVLAVIGGIVWLASIPTIDQPSTTSNNNSAKSSYPSSSNSSSTKQRVVEIITKNLVASVQLGLKAFGPIHSGSTGTAPRQRCTQSWYLPPSANPRRRCTTPASVILNFLTLAAGTISSTGKRAKRLPSVSEHRIISDAGANCEFSTNQQHGRFREEDMAELSAPDKLWDLANTVASFGVLQTIATIFTVTKGEFVGLRGRLAHTFAYIGTVVFAAFYVASIVWCGFVGSSLDKAENRHVWTVATSGRVIAILLFTAVMCLALRAHQRDEVGHKQ